MEWPSDADGDVMRRLLNDDFNFNRPATIDFYVAFEESPPSADALAAIGKLLPDATLTLESDSASVRVELQALVTYELVTRLQRELTAASAPFGGACDEWGVMVGPEER